MLLLPAHARPGTLQPTNNFKDKPSKLLLDNSIVFYVNRPKVDILPFGNKIDTNATLVNHKSEKTRMIGNPQTMMI